jgi:DNA-binding transcriptional MerR regulator
VNTEKSPEAFRTISEVADWLGTPAHVLRFWESRFPQVKPVKRAGGRRYYRPADMELLGGIKKLLHEDGLTIRGVQKLLRENGVRRVADLSPPLSPDLADARTRDAVAVAPRIPAPIPGRLGPEEHAPVLPDSLVPGGEQSVSEFHPPTMPVDPAGRASPYAVSGAPDAPMAADLVPAPQDPAEVVPLVLQPRQRLSPERTPDLFDLADAAQPEPGAGPGPADRPKGATDAADRDERDDRSGRLRMPPIPPDPSDADALPPGLPRRPVLPRRTAARPDDRLIHLFHRLADLRSRMDRSDP